MMRFQSFLDSRQIYYPTDEIVPVDGVVRPSLEPVVVEYNHKGEQRVNRITYELPLRPSASLRGMCVLSSLRDRLRNKSIWVVGANHYRNPDEDLPADFEEKRDTYYQALAMPLEAKTFIDQLQQQMHNALQMLDKNLPNNTKVKLKERNGGWISITPLKAQPEPRNALAELGAEGLATHGTAKVVKTIFLCHYLASEELRREIYEGLNVIENWTQEVNVMLTPRQHQ